MHAFIIEDDYLIAHSLQDKLEDLGFDSFGFARSEDAAVLVADDPQPIDLIFADVRLLPGDGVAAVKAICAARRVPVIYVTAYADDLRDRIPDALVLQKPINEERLAEAVRQALGARAHG